MSIVLVAHSALSSLVKRIGNALPVDGLYYPTGSSQPRDRSMPVYSNLTAMLEETGATTCAFLSPYQGMHRDVITCLESGRDTLCSGPVPQLGEQTVAQINTTSDVRLLTNGAHRFSPLFIKALEQRHHPSFAKAVYLRLVSGGQGPGQLSAWWNAYGQLAFAIDLLGETISQLHISACHLGRAYQITLTAATATGTSIQLTTAPQHSLSEMTLLGQGGVITASAAQSGIAIAGGQGTLNMPDVLAPAEIAWIQGFRQKTDPPAPLNSSCCIPDSQGLLRALRQALREGRPILLTP